MRKQLLSVIVATGACLVFGAQGQTSSDPSSSSPSTYPGSTAGSALSHSTLNGQRMSPTGRMGNEAVQSSQLIGAQVKDSAGRQLGTIRETIVDAQSGRVDFAVISLAGGTSPNTAPALGATDTTGTSTTSTHSSTPAAVNSSTPGVASALNRGSSNVAIGKQIAVPWMLLRPSPTEGTSAVGGGTRQPGFVFTGDSTKLGSAPAFDANTDLNQPSWRQSVFSYFGQPRQ